MRRLALIGAGRWGRNYIRTIAGLPQARLTRLASRNPDAAQWLPMGCALDADWRDTIAAADVDAVIIATPPQTHAAIAAAAIAAGKAVLVEKPLTLDRAEAENLANLAAAAGVTAWVEHTQLFNPAFQALQAALPRVGRLRLIRSQAGNHGPFRADVPVLWDWGAHDMAMMLSLTGGSSLPQVKRAALSRQGLVEGGLAAMVDVELAGADGVRAVCRFGNQSEKCRRLAVFGDAGTLLFDDLADTKLSLYPAQAGDDWPEGQGVALPYAPTPPLTQAVSEFVAALGQTVPSNRLDLGVAVVTLLEQCAKVAETHE